MLKNWISTIHVVIHSWKRCDCCLGVSAVFDSHYSSYFFLLTYSKIVECVILGDHYWKPVVILLILWFPFKLLRGRRSDVAEGSFLRRGGHWSFPIGERCRPTSNRENLLLCTTQRLARDLLVPLHMSLKSHFELVVLHGCGPRVLWPPLALLALRCMRCLPYARALCVSSLIKRCVLSPLIKSVPLLCD